jgi:uncharacterized damage-inducible protein DinB
MTPAELFLRASRGYLNHEYRIKLRRAVMALSPDALWARPNDGSNSVGNLLVHLEGNVRQWMVSGVGGAPDTRDRAAEFAARESGTAEALLARLEATVAEAGEVLDKLTPDDLVSRRTIQAREVTVLEAVYTCVQHFALHLGQIILVAKAQSPGAVQFYEDEGGRAKPIWKEQDTR